MLIRVPSLLALAILATAALVPPATVLAKPPPPPTPQPQADPDEPPPPSSFSLWSSRGLLPFHFGEPASDMRMLRLERTYLVKGGDGVGTLPRRQARVPVCKGLVR